MIRGRIAELFKTIESDPIDFWRQMPIGVEHRQIGAWLVAAEQESGPLLCLAKQVL